jgi:hypothetical protein
MLSKTLSSMPRVGLHDPPKKMGLDICIGATCATARM